MLLPAVHLRVVDLVPWQHGMFFRNHHTNLNNVSSVISVLRVNL